MGAEHGLDHDGLQADGSILLRMDWKELVMTKDTTSVNGQSLVEGDQHGAVLKVNPWLAYACGVGARVTLRKPGASEGTAGTVQRILRDDQVVVRRDGTNNDVTVDPTPFTVVPSSNVRHEAGTRLLLVHENVSTDALVEPWPGGKVDYVDSSRHLLAVSGKVVSGWISMVTRDGTVNMERAADGGVATAPAPAPAADSSGEDGEAGKIFTITAKTVVIRSGTDPVNSEKMGSLKAGTPVRLLERRETEEWGIRAYITSLPGDTTSITCALNEFNHSVQRFPTVAEYEAARANYLEDIVVREALVEDAITGNQLRIKDQTLHISTSTDASDNSRPIPNEWKVDNVLDLVKVLLVPSPNRACGSHSTQPVLVRAGPGTGKTWMAKQAVFTLADRLLRGGTGISDGIRLVPIVVFVQRIIYLLREDNSSSKGGNSLLRRYIESVYSGKKMEAWQEMLMQAYQMRALIVLLDGVDEAAGLRDQIDDFVHKEVVPSCNRVLVTSRPEGIKLATYSKTFVVMNLCQLTNAQQRRVINIQMEGNEFFDHLLSLGEVRKRLDTVYRKVGAVVRGELETLWSPYLWLLPGSRTEYDPDERQRIISGSRFVAEASGSIQSAFLRNLDEQMRSEETREGISLLARINDVFKGLAAEAKAAAPGEPPVVLELPAMQERVLEGMLGDEYVGAHHRVAVRLAMMLHNRQKSQLQKLSEAKTMKEATKPAKGKDAVKADDQAKEPAKADAGAKADVKAVFDGIDADETWTQLVQRTDEIYVVHEHLESTFEAIVKKLTTEVAKDDIEAKLIVKGIEFVSMKDPVRLREKAEEEFADRFSDGVLPEACMNDVTRCRVVLQSGAQIKDFISRIIGGIQLAKGGLTPLMPSEKAAMEAEAEAAGGKAPAHLAEPPPIIITELKPMALSNRFEHLDPTHFRNMVCQLKLTHQGASCFCEIEVHYVDILTLAKEKDPAEHYNFFRNRLAGTVPMAQLDEILDEKLVFLVDATGIPVLLSLLVLIFTAGGEDLTKLPSNRIELYELGIDSAITQRLVPAGFSSSDGLVSMWLRLFNLDRSAVTMTPAAGPTGGEQKKEREHRATRKAVLSMELKEQGMQVDQKADDKKGEKAGGKKKGAEAAQGQSKNDNKRLLSLDSKEVYEVFKHGAHYLREAVKPEVQRTELNRIELSMPKKLVDTVMMLVNANLKMLLGNRAQINGLTMLRQVAVANQEAGRREFASGHVSKALLIDQVNPEGMTLWLHLNKEEAGIPLTKTLEAQTEVAPAQYQFKHLSFQEGLFAQHLLMMAEVGWEGWENDEAAAAFLNNPFMNNTCRIAAGYLGTRLAAKRPEWSFSGADAKLSEVGLMALWLICERNTKLKSLELEGNRVGAVKDDAPGLSRMLATSTALETLRLGKNQVDCMPSPAILELSLSPLC